MSRTMFPNEAALLFSGEAGQGLNTVESVLSLIAKRQGLCVFATKEIMSRIRGGLNSSLLRISQRPTGAFRRTPDLLFSLQQGGVERLGGRIGDATTVFYDPQRESAPRRGAGIPVDLGKMAKDAGGKLFSNVAVVGLACAILDFPEQDARSTVESFFRHKRPSENLAAFAAGYAQGQALKSQVGVSFALRPVPEHKDMLMLSGSEAVGAGALAGGLNFIASYPMSPSTGVLMFLAHQAEAFGLLVEQAEDEIAAVNMCLGAWYAGARAMVTTSGGGFALMEEGVSLAGITETPCVIHVAQRPGPGTGLPTRTEQGDLHLVRYAGHGDFPRIIYAPGSVRQAFDLTRKAFEMADRYQIPVFVLTDQFLMDSSWFEDDLEYDGKQPERFVVESDAAYHRYAQTDSGISPRAIPGWGSGWVRADSDEHDARGEITEDFDERIRQVEKRMRKAREAAQDAEHFDWTGGDDDGLVLVTWGSNYGLGVELCRLLGDRRVSCLHFSQLHPLPEKALPVLRAAGSVVSIENNYAGQFGAFLRAAGIRIDHEILQYNGLPFAVEDVYEKVVRILEGGVQ